VLLEAFKVEVFKVENGQGICHAIHIYIELVVEASSPRFADASFDISSELSWNDAYSVIGSSTNSRYVNFWDS
jgi:Trk-type K+ transport system membrane component